MTAPCPRHDLPRPRGIPWLAAIATAAACVAAAPALAAEPDFEREIQPILAEHCGHCHGVDPQTRQGGLRLDIRDSALAGGDSGTPAIVPGKPAESEIVARIRSTDPDVIMPPPHEKKPLAPEQMRLLEEWIAAEAVYEPHWAFVPPRKAAVPAVGAAHPIDAFVHAHLAAKQIEPAPPADSATLCRRLHLDLVGLPPSPADLAAFERDGHEKTVDKLLASPRYGEKWARHWLDAARYADSLGYESDATRDMWAWRDWVVDAINADMPLDQFIVEQVAGDLLPGAAQSQIVATGFLRNSMTNEEGATIAEEFRMVEMFDRVDCLGRSVLGLTAQCAQCHTHKFDPLTHDEYFGLFAFLNNSYEARSHIYSPESAASLAAVRAQVAAVENEIRAARPDWQTSVDVWAEAIAAKLPTWTPLVAESLSSGEELTHPMQLPDKSVLMLGHRDNEIFMVAEPPLSAATGLQVEGLMHRDLLAGGPARDEIWGLAEVKLFVKRPDGDWKPVPVASATADFSAPQTGEGKAVSGPVSLLVDGVRESSWLPDRGPILRHQPSVAVVRFAEALTAPAGSKLKLQLSMMGMKQYALDYRMLGCFRASLTTAPEPTAPPVDHAAILAIRKAPADRTAADVAAMFTAWRKSVPDLAACNDRIAAAWQSAPAALTTALHLAEREPAMARATHRLDRGVWDKPLERIEPHVPAFLHPFPADAPRNRLGLARWLVDPRSPLFARVAVNQIWQAMFGTGLVETPDDLGTRSPVPEYRDLLDWLASDLLERGFSRKELIRQIVTSDTYRRSSQVGPHMHEADPTNKFLARGPRFRMDAEIVRDVVLAAAGLLTQRVGGPPVYPPVPKNMLEFNYDQIAWPEATGPDRYRRSVYLFRRRSMPDPVLSTLDSPNADIACLRRNRSNTPLAALVGLNAPIFVEAAQGLAVRTLGEAPGDDAARVQHAFLLCTSRPPTAQETQELLRFLAAQRKRIAEGWLDARSVASGDPDKLPDLPAGATPQDAAAWTLVARVLLNLDETVTKN